jgi:cysteine desulfurase
MSINLDNNATTRPSPEVVQAMHECLEADWGNPSSSHREGIAARRRVELARQEVASLLGCEESEVVFTSGGTEGANLAILGGFARTHASDPHRRLLVCPGTEHPAVRDAMQACTASGGELHDLEIDSEGLLDLDALEELLESRGGEIAMCSVMWVNNETGVIQPIERIGALCREHGVLFHTDAVQWVGRESCEFSSCAVDLLSCSGHKFHGPKGVGALLVRRGVQIDARSLGGPQERERRGGTENVPAIAGLGAACVLAETWIASGARDSMAAMRDRFEELLTSELGTLHVNGGGAPRTWNTTNIAFPGIEAQLLVVVLSEHGLAVSGGAACASGAIEASPVLHAMGIPPELAASSIRFSLARTTTEKEVEEAAAITIAALKAARTS